MSPLLMIETWVNANGSILPQRIGPLWHGYVRHAGCDVALPLDNNPGARLS